MDGKCDFFDLMADSTYYESVLNRFKSQSLPSISAYEDFQSLTSEMELNKFQSQSHSSMFNENLKFLIDSDDDDDYSELEHDDFKPLTTTPTFYDGELNKIQSHSLPSVYCDASENFEPSTNDGEIKKFQSQPSGINFIIVNEKQSTNSIFKSSRHNFVISHLEIALEGLTSTPVDVEQIPPRTYFNFIKAEA